MSTNTNRSPSRSPLPGGITVGFGVAVAMWVCWFLLHMPVVVHHFPPAVAGPLLLGVLVVGVVTGLRWVPRGVRVVCGGVAGVVAGVVNLMVMGSKLSVAGAGGEASLVPSAWLMVAGWIALCVVLGLGSGWVGRLVWKGEVEAKPGVWWLGRFAWVNTLAILPLLALGGLVTTAKAGFAVPDWPGTYGSNIFLYPIAMMGEPRIFLEHTHRLFGTLVGLTTVVLVVFALLYSQRGWMKAFACVLLGAVVVQGVIGGVWVEEKHLWLVLLHGVLGQLIFGSAALLATVLSPRWQRWAGDSAAGARLRVPRVLCLALLGTLLMQLIFGTLIRHAGSSHALWSHVGFSFVPVVLAVIAGSMMMRNKHDAAHGRSLWLVGHVPMIVVGLQFVLGFVALFAYLNDETRKIAAPVAETLAAAPAIDPLKLLARTVHQANGAVLLATAFVLAGWGLAHGVSKPAMSDE